MQFDPNLHSVEMENLDKNPILLSFDFIFPKEPLRVESKHPHWDFPELNCCDRFP